MNIVMLSGNIAQDIELKETQNGNQLAKLRVATSEWNGTERVPEFHNVIMWGDDAARAHQHLGKGDGIVLHGRIASRSWEADDGTKKYMTEIKCTRWEFSPGKAPSQGQPRSSMSGPPPPPPRR